MAQVRLCYQPTMYQQEYSSRRNIEPDPASWHSTPGQRGLCFIAPLAPSISNTKACRTKTSLVPQPDTPFLVAYVCTISRFSMGDKLSLRFKKGLKKEQQARCSHTRTESEFTGDKSVKFIMLSRVRFLCIIAKRTNTWARHNHRALPWQSRG